MGYNGLSTQRYSVDTKETDASEQLLRDLSANRIAQLESMERLLVAMQSELTGLTRDLRVNYKRRAPAQDKFLDRISQVNFRVTTLADCVRKTTEEIDAFCAGDITIFDGK